MLYMLGYSRILSVHHRGTSTYQLTLHPHTVISDRECRIILGARKSLLYYQKAAWNKHGTTLDVAMWPFDSAETCELVGSYITSKLNTLFGHSAGLYCGDELAAIISNSLAKRDHKKAVVFNVQISRSKNYCRS